MSWYVCMEILSDSRDRSTAQKSHPTAKVICTNPNHRETRWTAAKMTHLWLPLDRSKPALPWGPLERPEADVPDFPF